MASLSQPETGPETGQRSLIDRLRRRYLDLVASIYIYNEHRGYTSLDRVLVAVRARCPDDSAFIAAVEKHRADERQHYLMFKRYFELRGTRPYRVDRTCGHIDRFIERVFRCTIDELDTDEVIARPELFEKLCRVIMLTEQRGMWQLDELLRNKAILSDPVLTRIYRIIRRDEPSHWQPYQGWLLRNGRAQAKWSERMTDKWIHASLVFAKLPSLFFNPWLKRETEWRDAGEAS